ncbi:MAG: hypothetical protein ACHQQ3_01390 [Gemmatimonadales bacterium]
MTRPESKGELLAKRIILCVLGAAGVSPIVYGIARALMKPEREGIAMLAAFLIGATVALFVLPRWSRWKTTLPGNRTGAVFIITYMLPMAVLIGAGFKHLEALVVVAVPFAFGTTALWWSLAGYRLDRASGKPTRR